MRKIYLVYILLFICADLSAQNYYLRSLDIDSGLNNTLSPFYNKATKESVMINTTLMIDTFDAYGYFVYKTHFTKLDSTNKVIRDKSFVLLNSSFKIRGTIKLLQGGYLGYGLYYDSKSVKNKSTGIPGCIIRYNENGDTIFTKKFAFRKDVSDISSIRQLADSSYILLSKLSDSSLSSTSLSGIRVIKLNKNYITVWDSIYYYSDGTDLALPRILYYFDAIIQTEDKGFLIGTNIYIKSADTTQFATLFKIDSTGKFLWEKKYFGNDDYSGICKIKKLRDGNYLLLGYFDSYFKFDPKVTNFASLIKINPQGNVIWKKMIGKYEYQYLVDVEEFSNGNILLAGQSDVRGNTHVFDSQAALFCLDKNGKILWDRKYKYPSNFNYDEINETYFSKVDIASDNSIVAFGNIYAYDSTFPYNNHWNQDFLFLQADSLGCINPGTCPLTEIENIPKEPNYIYVYPNPSSNFIGFKSNLTASSDLYIKIINSIGQIVVEKKLSDFNETIDITSIVSGIYFVELKTDEVVVMQKVLIE